MDILVAPVSGGYFINQLAAFCNLAFHEYKPDIIFGASGGGISSTLFASSHFSISELYEKAIFCDSGLFISNWTPFSFTAGLSLLIGVVKGSLYDHSSSTNNIFCEITTPESLTETEIWILAFNNKCERATLFCNRYSNNSIIANYDLDLDMMNCTPRMYVGGDVSLFADVLLASASIPTFVPARKILNSYYTDGGLIYASPLTPLSTFVNSQDNFHIIYTCGYNLNSPKLIERGDDIEIITDVSEENQPKSILQNTVDSTDYLVKGHLLSERILIINMLSARGKLNYLESELEYYFEHKSEFDSSLLEIYPKDNIQVDILNFNGKESIKLMEKSSRNMGYRLWYI